ncbi:MarR family transcriptional regulator [Altererythrobacter indicus]|uniref:MarR family transcriptional regulator n=1 Tax=Altericroceibacterium indicum TaxID=374177 RepID=A0A845ABV3_9SPHN|nr:MarR family transcriptional regulator [Altericroceibacterium indicum]MXP26026.1 MarR family transcriptional regulator [Altericroceibacterium indicum]
MHDPLPNYPGYALRRAATATMAELATRLADIGLRQVDASTLILISANPGVTGSALARSLDIRRANMVPLLKGLEDAGLIERVPIDGKSLGLNMTELGLQKLAEAQIRIETFEKELLARVPEEHRAHLVPALNALWQMDS